MFFFITVFSFRIAAQLPFQYYRVTQYNAANGLHVDDAIYYTSTDDKGFVWVSTSNGLFRFSGTLFKNYSAAKNKKGSLPVDFIWFFLQDNKGKYWLNPDKHGVWNFNDSLNFFSELKLKTDSLGIKNYEFSTPFIDKENFLWIALQNKGLLKINTADSTYTFWDLKDEKGKYGFRSQSWVNNIYKDKTGTVWLATNNWLLALNEKTGTIKKYVGINSENVSESSVSGIYEDIDGTLWMGSWGHGLLHFYPKENKWEGFYIRPAEKNNTQNITGTILPKNENELWVGSEYGLLIFNKTIKQFFRCVDLENKMNAPDFLKNKPPEKYIDGWKLIFDKTQNLLAVSFDGKMINRLNLTRNKFEYQLALPGKVYNAGAFAYNYLTAPEGNKGGYFLTSQWGKGLYRYDVSGKSVLAVRPQNDFPLINVNDVYVKNNILWLCTNKGLFIYDMVVQKFITPPCKKLFNECNGKEITSLALDDENIFAGTYYGLLRYNIAKDSIEWMNQNNSKLPSGAISRLYTDHAGNTWIGMQEGMAVACFINKTGEIKSYNNDTAISTGNTEDITEQKDGTILFASRSNGVYKISNPLAANEKISLLTVADGLASNHVLSLFTDSDGFIWMCTANGLSIYNPGEKKFFNFFRNDGLMQDGIYSRCSEIKKGIIALPLKYGFTIINRDSLLKQTATALPIAIQNFTVNGKPYAINIQYVQKIAVPYNQNNFSLDFSALNFDNTAAIHYRYRLIGLSDEWASVSGGTNLTLFALPPGEFTLQLQSENINTHAQGKIFQLGITITPPFWKTWWFISLCEVLVAAAIYLFYRYRLQKALELERMRTNISSDLHDDVGATLSSISIFSQTAKQLDQTNPQRSAEIIERIGERSRQMLENMSDIVWSINPANDSLEKMLLRMRSYTTEILESKNIVLKWQQPVEISAVELNMLMRKNFYLFFKEAINNIAKYSYAENAVISLDIAKHSLQLIIKDDGIGYDPQNVQKGNGLTTMQQRSEMLKGKLTMRTNKNTGVEILLQVPLK